jgi:uncharacterized protein YPO0396
VGELNNIFSKLNIIEQNQLNNYINREVNKKIMLAERNLEKLADEKEKYLEGLNNKTWETIETILHMSMREYHISEERIKKIDARVNEISKSMDGKLLLGEERKSEFKILEDKDFQQMIELLMDSNCKNCHNRNYKCEVYGLLKKYNIPQVNGKCKCKYGYLKIGKKVV